MSQAGIINVIDNNPTIPIYFEGDTGFAVALFNTIRIVGIGGITTSATGNTVTIDGSGISFDLTLTGDTGGPLSPTADNFNIVGGSGANGTIPVQVNGVTSTLTVNVQKSAAIAASAANRVGLAAFNSTYFTVDANGFVSFIPGSVALTITGDSGGALSPTAGNWNLLGSGSITTVGAGSTLTTQLTGLTNHSVLVGAGTSTITKLAVGTNGQVLIGSSAADPVFSTLTSSDGSVTFTPGAGTLSLQVTGGTTVGKTITGNSGGALPPTSGNWNIVTANSTPRFVGSGSTLTVDFAVSSNLALGSAMPALTTGTANTGLGTGVTGPIGAPFQSLTIGSGNVAFGWQAGASIVDGNNNTMVGQQAGLRITSGIQNNATGSTALVALTTGDSNTANGQAALAFLQTGSNNVSIGRNSGFNYNGAESNNILIVSTGSNGESNTIRIGTNGSGTGQQNRAFMAGITGVTVAASSPIGIASTGQFQDYGFGTSGQVFTSNGAGVSPSWQAASGSSITLTGNTGGALSATGGNFNIVTSNSSVVVAGATSTLTMNFNLSNLVLGSSIASVTSGVRNVGLGSNVINALTSGTDLTVVGYQAGQALNSSARSTLIGSGAGTALTASVDVVAIGANALLTATGATESVAVGSGALRFFTTITSSRNTSIGHNSLTNLQTGVRNVALGYNAGVNYTTTESSNILIGNSGTVADANVVRIGNQGTGVAQQSTCFIAGITGATVTGTAVLCSTAGQLGTIASSIRYKENVKEMSEDVSIMKLRPVEFNYKIDELKRTQYGLIAEDINRDFPYLCFYNDNNEPESVKYHELPVLLLKEIQRLSARIEQLEKRITA